MVTLPDIGNGVVDSSKKFGRQGLDLNAGPGVPPDVEGRDETTVTLSRQVVSSNSMGLSEEQARMFHVAGGVLRRKDPTVDGMETGLASNKPRGNVAWCGKSSKLRFSRMGSLLLPVTSRRRVVVNKQCWALLALKNSEIEDGEQSYFKKIDEKTVVIDGKVASECSSGDLDGDLYFISWDENLCLPGQ
ncbi:hypothetical protein AKJ16_DCAP25314 [Drosera capensis]